MGLGTLAPAPVEKTTTHVQRRACLHCVLSPSVSPPRLPLPNPNLDPKSLCPKELLNLHSCAPSTISLPQKLPVSFVILPHPFLRNSTRSLINWPLSFSYTLLFVSSNASPMHGTVMLSSKVRKPNYACLVVDAVMISITILFARCSLQFWRLSPVQVVLLLHLWRSGDLYLHQLALHSDQS